METRSDMATPNEIIWKNIIAIIASKLVGLVSLLYVLLFASFWSLFFLRVILSCSFYFQCCRGNLVCLKLSPNLRRVHKDTKSADERTAREIELSKMERLIATNKGWTSSGNTSQTQFFYLVVSLRREKHPHCDFSSFDSFYFHRVLIQSSSHF